MTQVRYAIVGMDCLVPGADGVDEFWEILAQGQDCRNETDPRLQFSNSDQEHQITSTFGGFLSQETRSRVFAGETLLEDADDATRWATYVSRRALGSVSGDCLDRDRTGIFLGCYTFPTVTSSELSLQIIGSEVSAFLASGGLDVNDIERPNEVRINQVNVAGVATEGVADTLELGGPRVALDAACSSGLVALRLACDALASGEADTMIAGAVCAPEMSLVHLSFSDLGAYGASPAAPFTSDSTGITTGEGAAVVVIRRLSDAINDGNEILAIVDSVAVSNDGTGKHLLAPSPVGQQECYELAFAESRLNPADIDYIECHATGTPLGDRVELESLTSFFGDDLPLVGSVKGNIGHLLTAAGISSLIKVIIAMNRGAIPPTVGGPANATWMHDNVIRELTDWPDSQSPRRAAVSAFGFGGANAHVLVSLPTDADIKAGTGWLDAPVDGDIALEVTGLGAYLADGASLDDLCEVEWADSKEPLRSQLHPPRVSSDPEEFGTLGPVPVNPIADRIPPNDISNMSVIPQVTWVAVQQALADASITTGERRRIGVVVALDLDPRTHEHLARLRVDELVDLLLPDIHEYERNEILDLVRTAIHEPIGSNEVISYIGSLVAARISSLCNFTGASFTVSAGPNGVLHAIQNAKRVLRDESVEAVVVAAVDRATTLEKRLISQSDRDRVDGAVAFVLHRQSCDDAQGKSYGIVERISNTPKDNTHVPADFRGVVDVYAAHDDETSALAESNAGPKRIIVSTSHDWADAANAAPALGLVRLLLALHHRVLPSSQLKQVYAPGSPWLPTGQPRRAALAITGYNASGALLELREPELDRRRPAAHDAWRRGNGPVLTIVTAQTRQELVDKLTGLGDSDATELVDVGATAPECVVIVASAGKTADHAAKAADAIAGLSVDARSWTSPSGTRYARRIRQQPPKVGFMYPGAFTIYPGFGTDALRLVPTMMDSLDRITATGGTVPDLQRIYPVSSVSASPQKVMRYEQELLSDVVYMLGIGTTFALMYTDVYTKDLGLQPSTMIGYSLGASSMLFAADVWDRNQQNLEAIASSPVFHDELAGQLLTVKRAFGLEADAPIAESWRGVVILSDVAAFAAEIDATDDVYITHINTRKEFVLAGRPDAVSAILDGKNVRWAPYPVASPLHSDISREWIDDFIAMNRYPRGSGDPSFALDPVTAEPFDSNADTDQFAGRLAEALARTVDFPLLVSAAAQEADLLIEAGPGGTCARWAAESVPGLTTAAPDRRNGQFAKTWAAFLAILVSEGFEIDLSIYTDISTPTAHTETGYAMGLNSTIRDSTELASYKASVTLLKSSASADDTTVQAPASARLWDASSQALGYWWDDERPDDATLVTSPTSAPVASAATSAFPASTPIMPATTARTAPISADPIRDGFVESISASLLSAHQAAMLAQEKLLRTAIRSIDVSTMTGQITDHSPEAATVVSLPITSPAPADDPVQKNLGLVYNEEDLLTFATGKIANVFGPEYAEIDTYKVRVRLPAPPYHFVTRVTALEGNRGKFERSTITTEYDVPEDAWYSIDGGVPPAVTIESGQADLLLSSWLGIDFENKGERSYRLLDSTLVFHGDLPLVGQTLRYEIVIDRFLTYGDITLFYFHYQCFADDNLILELTEATAGFFTQEQLSAPLGIVKKDLSMRTTVPMTGLDKPWFKPVEVTDNHDLNSDDLAALAQGDIAAVFGESHRQPAGTNPALRLPDTRLRMMDRILIDPHGGTHGMGRVTAWKKLEPDAWYFTSHFVDDPVLAGSLIAEGGVQILQVLLLHHGFHLVLPDARFQTIIGLKTNVAVRGQVTPEYEEIRYEIDVREITLLPRPMVIADIIVCRDGQPATVMTNFGVQIREKPGTSYRPGPCGKSDFLGRTTSTGVPALINELQLEHAALGNLGTAMGPEFDIYDNRRAPHIPNRDFRFVDRIESVTGERGQLKPGMQMVSEFDAHADSWYYTEVPSGQMPHAVLLESSLQSAILLGYYQGATLAQPDVEFSIRNLHGTAQLVGPLPSPGATIRQTSTLLSSAQIRGNVLQNFSYELETKETGVFYTGESMFGFFSEEALANQVGLDAGEKLSAYCESHDLTPDLSVREQEIDDRYRRIDSGLAIADGRLTLLHEAEFFLGGGPAGLGSVRARRLITPDDWYFTRHFHRDPVQPGSLGIEAMIQALQMLSLERGLTESITNPQFTLAQNESTTWIYRGQVLRTDKEYTLEVLITDISTDNSSITIRADGHLWKNGLRIYEVNNLALNINSKE